MCNEKCEHERCIQYAIIAWSYIWYSLNLSLIKSIIIKEKLSYFSIYLKNNQSEGERDIWKKVLINKIFNDFQLKTSQEFLVKWINDNLYHENFDEEILKFINLKNFDRLLIIYYFSWSNEFNSELFCKYRKFCLNTIRRERERWDEFKRYLWVVMKKFYYMFCHFEYIYLTYYCSLQNNEKASGWYEMLIMTD